MKKPTHSEIRKKVDMSSFMNAILENSRIACILLLTGEGIIMDISKGMEEQFGYTFDDLYGKHFSLLYTETDLMNNRPEEELKEALNNGFGTDNNYLLHKNGIALWCHGESVIVKNQEGERYFVKVVYDINKQKELEKSLRTAKKFSEGITETISEALIVVDNNFNVLMTNSFFNENYNTENKEIKQRSFFEIIKGMDGPSLRKQFEELLPHAREIKNFEFEYECPRLGKRTLNLNAKQITQEREKQLQILIIINDITLQKQASVNLSSENAELNIINKDLDTFVYTASHDLKAPINNLHGLITSLKEESDEGLRQQLMNMIDLSLEQLKNTVADLAEVGKAQARKGGDISIIAFSQLLEEIKLMLKNEIEESKAVITEDFSRVSSIHFSRKNLRSIMQNLISNALKYRHPDRIPEIFIRTSKVDQYILLEVADNGLGIKESDKSKVFEMYQRLHEHVEGSGVGMSLVARIVNGNGGKIEIQSEEGKGSIFKVFLKV
ncbi:MAG: PAS domain S-box protein [Cytophagaceae bacterium]